MRATFLAAHRELVTEHARDATQTARRTFWGATGGARAATLGPPGVLWRPLGRFWAEA